MKSGFIPIKLEQYVDLVLKENRGTDRVDLMGRLKESVNACKEGVRCRCGQPIWAIGSAEVGFGCFTCITGEGHPDSDYEIDEVCYLHLA
jgi:hypothetical protein